MTVSPNGGDGSRPGDLQMSLVDVSKDYIRSKITAGDFPPGFRLKERELSTELGISRIPIREAVRDLSTEGFVTLLPRRGAVVTELRPEDLDDIFEVRLALEVTECALAARRASDAEIARLRACVVSANNAMAAGERGVPRRARGDGPQPGARPGPRAIEEPVAVVAPSEQGRHGHLSGARRDRRSYCGARRGSCEGTRTRPRCDLTPGGERCSLRAADASRLRTSVHNCGAQPTRTLANTCHARRLLATRLSTM